MSDLNDISGLGLFANDDDVPKTVTVYDKGNPVEGVVYIRRLPSVDIDRFTLESRNEETRIRVNAIPRLLAKAVRKADGEAHFTAELAAQLTNANRSAFLAVVMEVNKAPEGDELGK